MPPSGTQIEDAKKAVKQAIWANKEEERITRIKKAAAAKAAKEKKDAEAIGTAPPSGDDTSQTTGLAGEADQEARGGLLAGLMHGASSLINLATGVTVDEVEEVDADGEPQDTSLTANEMPEDYQGGHSFVIWERFGPLAPEDDRCGSLVGPGETDGRARSQTSHAFQKGAKHKKAKDETGADTNGSSVPLSQVPLTKKAKLESDSSSSGSGDQSNDSTTEMRLLRKNMEKAQKVENLKLLLELEEDQEERVKLKSQLKAALRQSI